MASLILRTSISEVPFSYSPSHYVAPFASVSGAVNDYDDLGATAWTNATSALTPTTLGTAMARAQAGNVVELNTGIYSGLHTGNRQNATFEPTNSGTSSNRIVWVCKYQAAKYPSNPELYAEVRNNGTNVDGQCSPVIGVNGTAYHTFSGFYIRAAQAYPAATGGSATAWNTTGIIYEWCRFDATGAASSAAGWNANAIHAENVSSLTIKNNKFIENVPLVSGAQHNNACIETYGCPSLTIEHNDFSVPVGPHVAVYVKGTAVSGTVMHSDLLVRFNKMKDAGLEMGAVSSGQAYQNLIYGNAATAGIIFEDSASQGFTNLYVYNNTIDVTGTGVLAARIETTGASTGGNRLYNNILCCPTGSSSENVNAGDTGAGDILHFDYIDYNFHYKGGVSPRFSLPGTQYVGLVDWRAALLAAGTGVNARETNSQTGDPLFTNSGAGTYTLQVGSAARTASSTAGPCGCYITGSEEIGLESF